MNNVKRNSYRFGDYTYDVEAYRPIPMKFSELFNTRSKTTLRKLCAFISVIFSMANTR